MQDKLNIAVFVDYDNIEIGVKSTLQREFEFPSALDALKERGDIVAKFAYANWARQEGATRQMAENAVQMVQRIPSPRGDKNGADINLALDALEMAFTHTHVNAFAIVSGDSDFIPLVNKLKEFGKTVFVLGGKAFTSTILQQNCHEFISYESLLDEPQQAPSVNSSRSNSTSSSNSSSSNSSNDSPAGGRRRSTSRRPCRWWSARCRCWNAAECSRNSGCLKSTMLQLDATFSEKAYGCSSFSDFVEKLKHAGYVNLSGSEGPLLHRAQDRGPAGTGRAQAGRSAAPAARRARDAPHRDGEWVRPPNSLEAWVQAEHADFTTARLRFPGVRRAAKLRAGQAAGAGGARRGEGTAGLPRRRVLPARPAGARTRGRGSGSGGASAHRPRAALGLRRTHPAAQAAHHTRRRKPAGQTTSGEARKPRARRPPSRSRSMPPAE